MMKAGSLMVDGPKLWDMLDENNLLNKPISEMDLYQISALAEIMSNCVHGHTPSFWIQYSDGIRCICTPRTAPWEDKIHLHKDERLALYKLLLRLGATEEDMTRYGLSKESRELDPLEV
jgi:hypothetical protein